MERYKCEFVKCNLFPDVYQWDECYNFPITWEQFEKETGYCTATNFFSDIRTEIIPKPEKFCDTNCTSCQMCKDTKCFTQYWQFKDTIDKNIDTKNELLVVFYSHNSGRGNAGVHLYK